jgi:hypothetical protein
MSYGADWRFILARIESMPPADKRDADKVEEVYKRAWVDLLRSDIPLGQDVRNMVATGLERLWWPDPKAEGRWRHLMEACVMRRDFEAAIADGQPPKEAKDKLARHWDRQSGGAFGKAIQPSRAGHHKPRR